MTGVKGRRTGGDAYAPTGASVGSLYVVGTDGLMHEVAPGASGDVLTSNGAGSEPTYQAPAGGAGGGFTLISSVTTSGSQASVTFGSIAGSYKALLLRVVGRSNISGQDNDTLLVQFNSDGGSNYKWVRDGAVPSSPFQSGSNSATSAVMGYVSGGTSASGYPGYSEITIPQYAATAWKKSASGLFIGMGGSDIYAGKISLNWNNTAAIASILVFLSGSNTFVNGSVVELIGISY